MQAFSGSSFEWNELIASLPNPHLLQTWEWAQVKDKYSWQPMPYIWTDLKTNDISKPVAAAMILKRSLPVRGLAKKMCVLYVPKGPLLDWGNTNLRQRVVNDLQDFANQQGAIFVKIDPDVELGRGVPGKDKSIEFEQGEIIRSELLGRGWKFSQDQIQFRNTVLIDLSAAEDQMLARMKQKTRYNIRLAQKKGVTVRKGTLQDGHLLYQMYAETSVRDGFLIREEGYYQTVWNTFDEARTTDQKKSIPISEPLIAEVDGKPVGAVSMFYFGGLAIYLFGMSRLEHREKMPNYLLQWEAMRRAKSLGCRIYNLWGAPDIFNPDDDLWGVFRFKEGLGGYVSRTIGAWDYTSSSILYRTYTEVLPRILDLMRARGKARTRQSLN